MRGDEISWWISEASIEHSTMSNEVGKKRKSVFVSFLVSSCCSFRFHLPSDPPNKIDFQIYYYS
jgi:hypothetical protein